MAHIIMLRIRIADVFLNAFSFGYAAFFIPIPISFDNFNRLGFGLAYVWIYSRIWLCGCALQMEKIMIELPDSFFFFSFSISR